MSRRSLGKILILLICLIFIVGLISTMVRGQVNENTISYIQVDIPQILNLNRDINIKIGLIDNIGSPILGKSYGNSETQGTWFIENIKNANGKLVEFEVIEDKELGKGNYQGTINITSSIDKTYDNKYLLTIGYVGDSLTTEKVSSRTYEFSLEGNFVVRRSNTKHSHKLPKINLLNINPTRIYYVNSLNAGTTITLNGSYKVLNSTIDVIQTSFDGISWRNAIINRKSATWSTDIMLPSNEGKYKLFYRGRDKAGIYSINHQALNIILDKTPPRITYIEGKGENNGKTKVKDVKLHWKQVKDNLAGVDHFLLYRNDQLIRPFYLDNLQSGKNGYFYDNFAIDKITNKEIDNLQSKKSLDYKVCSVDKAGNISTFSNITSISYSTQQVKTFSSYSVTKMSLAQTSTNLNVSTFISPHGDYETGYRTSYCSTCHNTHNSIDIHLVKNNESTLCLECHNGNGSNYIISGYGYGSAHYYDSTNNENGYSCRTCHNSHGTNYSAFIRFSTNNELCLSCHNESSQGDNIQTYLSMAYGHKTSSCTVCHNSHMAKSTNALLGISGVSVNRNNETPFTYKSLINEEYELCYKCHSEYSRVVSDKAIIVSTDVAVDFNPNNRSFHAVEGLSKAEFITDSTFRGLDRNGNPWSYTSKVYCTDCHGPAVTYPEEPKVKGVHGSTNLHLLKGWFDTSKTWNDINQDINNFLCFRCHNPKEYISNIITSGADGSNFRAGTTNLHNSGKHDFPCWQCHGKNLHGNNREHLIATSNQDSSFKITEFQHAESGFYQKINCSTSCHTVQP